MAEAPKRKRSSAADLKAQFEGEKKTTSRSRSKKKETTEAKADSSIKSNTFYKILFDKSTSASDKKAAIETALVFEGTKVENAERVAEFEAVKEYLQLQRQRMAKEFMKLADTKSFAELKDVIDQMNQGLIEFDERMQPLAEILDAVYTLRTGGEGLIEDAYKDIEADRQAEEEKQAKLDAENKELDRINAEIKAKENEIADLSAEKAWFGFGGIKKDAQKKINRAQNAIRNLRNDATEVSQRLQDIASGVSDRDDLLPDEFADAKAKLRELLDISSEEHSQRQKDLVDAARNFVDHAQTRTGSVLAHLEGMSARTENIADANAALRSMYAIMDDASKDAAKTNKQKAEEIKEAREAENLSSVEAMELDDKITAVNDHITNLDRTSVDTSSTLADLSEQSGRILTMKDRTNSQISKTRGQMTSGIGGVADRLVGVLTAVSLASLSESSELMSDSIQSMDAKTRKSTEQEVFQKVLGQKLQNDDLAKALEEAAEFREVLGKGTDLYREQVAETHDLVDQMSAEAEELRAVVEGAKAAHADAQADFEEAASEGANDNEEPEAGADNDADDNPFAFDEPATPSNG